MTVQQPLYLEHDCHGTDGRTDDDPLRPFLLPLMALAVVGLFLVAPWSLDAKLHAVLHGLCAQRASHTLHLGGRLLPFDARMTGIYGGFFVTTAYLLVRGRFRSFRLPRPAIAAMLGLFVAAMAVDGFNSLLLDLGLRHLYTPQNALRLVTGQLTGITLSTVVCFLLATSLWRDGHWHAATIGSLRELGVVVAIQAPFVWATMSGMGLWYVPVALLLMMAAIGVVAMVMLVVLVLLRRADRTFDGWSEIQVASGHALLLGITLIGVLGATRYLLEHLTNVRALP